MNTTVYSASLLDRQRAAVLEREVELLRIQRDRGIVRAMRRPSLGAWPHGIITFRGVGRHAHSVRIAGH